MVDRWDRSTVDMPGSGQLHPDEPVRSKIDRLGRYTITGPIASGGMGSVYSAHDPELDRNVALKVVHPRRSHNPGSHARLLKEARALARLDHPNVVKVHDVFSEHGQIVVVMELVDGATLAEWEAAEHRSWREIVAAYAQAGEGLAAAHELEIVHRDFKPANAVIGPDGRVRVLDFGLAQIAGGETEASDPASSGAITQTIPGAVMGTPGYAAPEQLSGDSVTVASDQFSFCVALHRALEGIAPFSGETIGELVAAIRTKAPATSDRDLPSWLRALLRTGLMAEPHERHPSMRTLLRELTRARGVKRWWKPGMVGALVVAAAISNFAMRADSDTYPCSVNETVTIWNPIIRANADVSIERLSTPYAKEVAAQVLPMLDRYASALALADHAACLAHFDGETSDAMFDRETVCFERKRKELTLAIRAAGESSTTTVSGIVDVVAGLRAPDECMRVDYLSTTDAPSREESARVDAVRIAIASASTLKRAGRLGDATISIQSGVAAARKLAHQPVLADALMEQGRILFAGGEYVDAIPVLSEAMRLALANGLTALAVEASARRIYANSQIAVDLPPVQVELDLAESMSRSLKGDVFARALLLNNAGAVYAMAGMSADAMRYYEMARRAVSESGDSEPDLELTAIDLNIAMMTRDTVASAKLFASTIDRIASRVGPHHPLTLSARFTAAANAADARTSLRQLEPVCNDYLSFQPTLVVYYVMCEQTMAQMADALGDNATMKTALEAVVSHGRGVSELTSVVELSDAELQFLGRQRDAIAQLRRVVSHNLGRTSLDMDIAGEARLFIARDAVARGDTAAARLLAEQVRDSYSKLAETNFALTYRLHESRASEIISHL